jgi:cytochrome b involved in lipid metabolism
MLSKTRMPWFATGALTAAVATVVLLAGTSIPAAAATTYTVQQVKTHATSKNCWTVVNGKIYNLTTWIPKHPGGAGVITAMCGKDSTAAFKSKHGLTGIEATMLADYQIATLSKVAAKPKPKATAKPKPKAKPRPRPKPVVYGNVSAGAVADHKAATDCWTIINNNIYDLTSWVAKHPGGPAVIKAMCGIDASAAFVGAHGTMGRPIRTLGAYLIGTFTPASRATPLPPASDTTTVADTGTAGVTLTTAEVAKHTTAGSCWTIINGSVYNLTNWVNGHPGGSSVILAICGIDGSAAFAYHKGAKNPGDTLSGFFMGAIGSTAANTVPAPAPSMAPKPAPTVTPPAPTGSGTNGETLTVTIVAAHATAANCWTVINNNVYDLTNWVNSHPGGSSLITAICGKDGSAAFNGYGHSNQTVANSTLASFKIGTLGSPATVGTPPPAPTPAATAYLATDISAHSTRTNCWSAINLKVYDLTSWVDLHPGGWPVIAAACGRNASAVFTRQHGSSASVNLQMQGYAIGVITSAEQLKLPTAIKP